MDSSQGDAKASLVDNEGGTKTDEEGDFIRKMMRRSSEAIAMKEDGWGWAVGDKKFQLITALIVLIHVMMMICALISLFTIRGGGGGELFWNKGATVPPATWSLRGNPSDPPTTMPLFNLNINSKVHNENQQCKAVGCGCDWAHLDDLACPPKGKANCTAPEFKDGPKTTDIVGLSLFVFGLAGVGCALFVLQLRGIVPMDSKIVGTDGWVPPDKLGQKVLFLTMPVKDRVIVSVLMLLFALITGGMASGLPKDASAAIPGIEVTRSSKVQSCFVNAWNGDCGNANCDKECRDPTKCNQYHDLENGLDAWTKWAKEGGRPKATSDGMWAICFFVLISAALQAFLVLRRDPMAAQAKLVLPKSKQATVNPDSDGNASTYYSPE